MSNLTQIEVNAIRECVCSSITSSSKLSSYATKASDAEIKDIFKSSSISAEQTAQKLIQLL